MFDSCAVGSGASQVLTLSCVFPLIADIIYWALVFAGTVSVVVIIVSGIRLIVSGGEAKTVEVGKKSMEYAILGLLLIFFSFFILNFIGYVTGVACLNINNLSSGFQSCAGGGGGGGGGTPIYTCSSSNPDGSCPTGQTCGYDSTLSMHTCLYNCDSSHTSGYCPSGTTCAYDSTSGIWRCQ